MKTILLVDDEPTARSILRCQLSAGYDVFDIDLLICDEELGLISGAELASLLRTWNSKLRTILTTDLPFDHWGQQLEIELAELPADDVLILGRPFTLSQLRRQSQTCYSEKSKPWMVEEFKAWIGTVGRRSSHPCDCKET